MELPAGVLAYRLLKSAEISEDKQQLTRATLPSFSYDSMNSMKKQLKAIYFFFFLNWIYSMQG